MKTTLRAALACAALLYCALPTNAQCNFNPTVTGNLLLCPETVGTLSTQQYAAYQWYTRPFGSNDPAQPVSGATAQTFEVDAFYTPVYVSVAATLDGCTEQSPEVLVDGLAFLPVTVSSTGEFDVNSSGEFVICSGDSIFMEALLPYTLNFQWYNDEVPINGANDDTLIVTEPGAYWVTASPGACPDWTATLGVQLRVVWGTSAGCVSSIDDPEQQLKVEILPNPARDRIRVTVADFAPVALRLLDTQGKVLRERRFAEMTELDVADLPAGVYLLHLNSENGSAVRRVVVE